MEYTECPNCGASTKSGFFANAIIPKKHIQLVNEYTENNSEAYCKKCSQSILDRAIRAAQKDFEDAKSAFENLLPSIPILSIHHPHGWDYQSFGIVTGQSVTGTGVISEISSSFTDFFGTQSGAFSSKLAKGELNCMNQLRLKAVKMGCNAIIGADIDYAEVGSIKGMLMVCMTGTAIKLKNLTEVGYDQNIFIKITSLTDTMEHIRSLMPDWTGFK
mgnify:CR=1 FL=1